MWNRLEEYYRDSGAILSSIHHDLDALMCVENGSHKDFVAFVTELEVIHECLSIISDDHQTKIDVNKVDKLAKLLPEYLRIHWNDCKMNSKMRTGKVRFLRLLFFSVRKGPLD